MFDKAKIAELFPEAENLMIPSMGIWKLPEAKQEMLSDICKSGEYFLQEKIDGVWYQFVRTPNYKYLFGRKKSVKTNLLTEKGKQMPHILDALSVLPPNTVVIGEVFVPGGTSKEAIHFTGCLWEEAIERQKQEGYVHYYVHDIIVFDGKDLTSWGAERRYDFLKKIWKDYSLQDKEYLHLAVKIDNNLETEIARILDSGGEGAVLKKKDYPYVPDKKPAWSCIKVKQEDESDVVCIGVCEATREYTGKELESWIYWEEREEMDKDGNFSWGKILSNYYEHYLHNPHIYRPITKAYFYGWPGAIRIGAYDKDGKLVELGTVSSGLTDEDKQNIAKNPKDFIGKVLSLKCMSLDKKEKTFRHPNIKLWRDDKNADECKVEEIFA